MCLTDWHVEVYFITVVSFKSCDKSLTSCTSADGVQGTSTAMQTTRHIDTAPTGNGVKRGRNLYKLLRGRLLPSLAQHLPTTFSRSTTE